MGQETRQKTAKKAESARTTTSRRNACRGAPNEYDFIREEIRNLWTAWAHTSTTSDLWRRIEQSGLDNALRKLATTKPELAIISGVSSEDAANVSGVMTEFSEVLSCIRLAYSDNESEILDGEERENKYVTSTCPTILEVWRAYNTFAAEYAAEFVQSSWLNSSEHRALLGAVMEMAGSSVKLLVVAVDMTEYHSLDNIDTLHSTAITEASAMCKVLEELLGKVFALGDSHSAVPGLMELVGWTLYGLTHVTNKTIKVGLEARAPESSLEDHDELVNNINDILKATQDKWSIEPSKVEPAENDGKRSREQYVEVLQKLGQVYQKYSDEAWETQRLPVLHGSAGVQMLYRMECYDELDKFTVDACPMAKRKQILDSMSLSGGHVLHSDIFVIGPAPLECSKEVTLKFPLLSGNQAAEGSNIYLVTKEGEDWREVEQPEKVEEDDSTYIVFRATKCEAFAALSFSPSDALMVGPAGATYVSEENGKVEVVVPPDCFTGDVTLGIKVLPWRGGEFLGTVQGSHAVELTAETAGMEMRKAVTVQLPLRNDGDDKDTELVVVRYNDTSLQVLDKKQMTVRMVDSGVYAVDFKGFWCIAVLRIKRIFLNMRESVKKEFLIGYGKKVPCNILTFIDDVTRGEEKQTFVMEIVERRDAENVVDARRQMGLVEIKKGRSKDVLLKRGDQIMMIIDGQMRPSEALKEEDQTMCYLQGTSNVVTIATEIKRDPEKFPDAMVIYKQLPNESSVHSLAIMTRDLSELPTEAIVARTSTNVSGIETKKSKLKEEGTNILKHESLMSLARELTFAEGATLGQQLGVKADTIAQISEATESDHVAGNFQILCNWRGRFARATMADFLVSSLKAVGKLNYADLVAEVRKHNRCLEKEDFDLAKKREKINA